MFKKRLGLQWEMGKEKTFFFFKNKNKTLKTDISNESSFIVQTNKQKKNKKSTSLEPTRIRTADSRTFERDRERNVTHLAQNLTC